MIDRERMSKSDVRKSLELDIANFLANPQNKIVRIPPRKDSKTLKTIFRCVLPITFDGHYPVAKRAA